jgi:hypothetical protein
MARVARFLAGGLLAVAVLATGACGSDDPTGPQTGSIEVLLTMEGADLDVDGGTLMLDGEVAGVLVNNVGFLVEGVSAGIHLLEVTGIADNCSIAGANERNVTVVAGQRADEQFSFLCESTEGKEPGDGSGPVA